MTEEKKATYTNERHKLLHKIVLLENFLSGQGTALLKPFNITNQQFTALRILSKHHPQPMTVITLRATMPDRMCDITRLLDRLEKENLVIRKKNLIDKRVTEVFLSSKGMDLVNQANPHWDSLLDFNGLDEAEIGQMLTLIDKILPVEESETI